MGNFNKMDLGIVWIGRHKSLPYCRIFQTWWVNETLECFDEPEFHDALECFDTPEFCEFHDLVIKIEVWKSKQL
jgi:hypothetical protein